jgi:Flp pilus assembly protein TadG
MVGMRRLRVRKRSCPRGAAALELALVAPMLVLLMLGCIDFGRFPSTSIAVRNAARVGADFARINPYPASTGTQDLWKTLLRQAVLDEMSGFQGFDAQKMTLQVRGDVDPASSRSQVKVQVVYPFQTLVDWNLQGLNLPHQFNLRQEVVMDLPPGYPRPPDVGL